MSNVCVDYHVDCNVAILSTTSAQSAIMLPLLYEIFEKRSIRGWGNGMALDVAMNHPILLYEGGRGMYRVFWFWVLSSGFWIKSFAIYSLVALS